MITCFSSNYFLVYFPRTHLLRRMNRGTASTGKKLLTLGLCIGGGGLMFAVPYFITNTYVRMVIIEIFHSYFVLTSSFPCVPYIGSVRNQVYCVNRQSKTERYVLKCRVTRCWTGSGLGYANKTMERQKKRLIAYLCSFCQSIIM